MWTLRHYRPDDSLLEEFDLPFRGIDEAAAFVGHRPTRYGSTPLDAETVRQLAARFALPVTLNGTPDDDVAFFLDFEGYPEDVTGDRENVPEQPGWQPRHAISR